ncbi:hypothetical protein [Caldisericum sp.]|uniref:hypothetical protein n=1 Tax=Caldisericum sp. TaxID=2499687 RepID=UPI003D119EC1
MKAVYPDRWKEILSLAFFTLSFNKPLYLFNEWASHTYLANQKEMSSKKVSKLLKELGDDARSQNNFFFAWGDHAKDTSSVIFVEEEDIEIEGNRFHLFLYLDKKREALEGRGL